MHHDNKKLRAGLIGNVRVRFICQFILGGTFVFASLSKISDPHVFADAIIGYDLIPSSLAYPMAVVLPFLELFIGILIIMDIWTRQCTVVLSALLIIFIIANSTQ